MNLYNLGRGAVQWLRYGSHAVQSLRAHLDDPHFARLSTGYLGPVQIASLRTGGASAADLMLRRHHRRFHYPQQRPAVYFPFLSASPFLPSDNPARILESQVDAIRQEFRQIEAQLHGHPESWLVGAGRWDIFKLYRGGLRQDRQCALAPTTMQIVDQLPHCGAWLGMVYFSVLQPGTSIKPHCGLTNGRIRYHLGIEVADDLAWIEVAGQRRPWENGRCMVFDDSFCHRVEHRGSKRRVVLIVDLWHPELLPDERRILMASGLATGFEAPFER